MFLIIQIVLGIVAVGRGWPFGNVLLIFLGMFALGLILAAMGFSAETIVFADVLFTVALAGMALVPPQKEPSDY